MLLHEYPFLKIYHEVYLIDSHAVLLLSEELSARQNSHKVFNYFRARSHYEKLATSFLSELYIQAAVVRLSRHCEYTRLNVHI